MSEKIQIGIACGPNSEHYVNFLMESIKKTASNLEQFEFLLGVNTESVDKAELEKNSDVFNIKIFDMFAQTSKASKAHGKCLDEILDMMDTKYGMIIDCDVAFLEKDWDIKLKSKLKDNVVIVGSDTDPSHYHYKNFPSWIMTMFLVDVVKECEVSFCPDLEYAHLDEDNCKYFGQEPGTKVYLDTGWQLSYKLRKQGYEGLPLPMVSPRLGSKNLVFMEDDMRGEEHHLDGIPIFTHIGRSMSRDFHNNNIIKRWRKSVENWLEEKK